jgi:hypothetical protein
MERGAAHGGGRRRPRFGVLDRGLAAAAGALRPATLAEKSLRLPRPLPRCAAGRRPTPAPRAARAAPRQVPARLGPVVDGGAAGRAVQRAGRQGERARTHAPRRRLRGRPRETQRAGPRAPRMLARAHMHTRTHARTHAHARNAHARTHIHAHTHTHTRHAHAHPSTHAPRVAQVGNLVVAPEDTLFGLETDPGRAISRDTVRRLDGPPAAALSCRPRRAAVLRPPPCPSVWLLSSCAKKNR